MDRPNIKKIYGGCWEKDTFIENGKPFLKLPIHYPFQPSKWENKVPKNGAY